MCFYKCIFTNVNVYRTYDNKLIITITIIRSTVNNSKAGTDHLLFNTFFLHLLTERVASFCRNGLIL